MSRHIRPSILALAGLLCMAIAVARGQEGIKVTGKLGNGVFLSSVEFFFEGYELLDLFIFPSADASIAPSEKVALSKANNVEQFDSLRPDCEVGSFLGTKRMFIEVRHYNIFQVGRTPNSVLAPWIGSLNSLSGYDGPAIPKGLNQLENLRVVGSKYYVKDRSESPLALVLDYRKAGFSICETAKPVAKIIAVDFVGELADRIDLSHDLRLLNRRGCDRGRESVTSTSRPTHFMPRRPA